MRKLLFRFVSIFSVFPLLFGSYVDVDALSAPEIALAPKQVYVAPDGNDSNSGSATSPFKTFAKAVSVLTAGDTLQVMAGTYTETLALSILGTASAPIAVVGSGAVLNMQGGKANGIAISGSYINVSGFEVIGATDFGILVTGKYVRVENNNVHDNVTKNGVGTCGLSTSWGSAVKVKAGGENTVIRNNVVYNNCGEGIAVTRGMVALVENNTVYDNFGVNIYVDNSPFVTVQNNISYCTGTHLRNGNRASGIALGEEAYSGWGAQLHDVLISGNTITDCRTGVSAYASDAGGTLTNVTITNNAAPSGQVRGISIQTTANQNVLISYNSIFNDIYINQSAGVTLVGNIIGGVVPASTSMPSPTFTATSTPTPAPTPTATNTPPPTATAAMQVSQPQTSILPPGNWNFLFGDEFDGSSVDTSKWRIVNDTRADDQNKTFYRPENVAVGNGILSLTINNAPITAANYLGTTKTANYTGGMLESYDAANTTDTKKFRNFQYGYFEARIKYHMIGCGFWSNFWMFGRPTGPAEFDMEIMSCTGSAGTTSRANQIRPAYHYLNTSGASAEDYKFSPLTYNDTWHVYGILWLPDQPIKYYIDGVEIYTPSAVAITADTWKGTPSSLMYMALRAGAFYAATTGGLPTSSTEWPGLAQYDWVRVYSPSSVSTENTQVFTSTPAPTASATPVLPTATVTATMPTVVVSASPSPTATNSPTPTATPVPFTPTSTATNSPTPTATAVPFTPTPTATNSPTFTATAVPFTPTPTATNTAVPTVTTQPTSTPITPIVVSSGENSVDIRVAKGSDDVEENSSGRMYTNSSDLELIYDKSIQVVGIRFTGVKIPMGATITNAYIQFKVDETNSKTIYLTVGGEASANASAFSNTARNVSKRARTSNSVIWAPPSWSKVGEMGISQRTPNLSSIVQEIVNQPNWNSGNSIVMIISGENGKRTAKSFEGDSAGAPLLHIEYSMQVKEAMALLSTSTPTPTPTATLITPMASPTVTATFTPEPTQMLPSPTAPATEIIVPTETPSPTPIPPSPTIEAVTPTETPIPMAPVETALKATSATIKATEAVNIPPVIMSNGNLSIAENTAAVTTVTATDTDLPTQSLTYSIASGVDSALFAINPSTGELSFITAPDFESPADAGSDNIYNIIVQASDGTFATTQDIVVTVTEVNDNVPTITSVGNLSIVENTMIATTVTATDVDLPVQPLIYSISGGPDSGLFSINSSTGELTFITMPDFEIPTDSGLDNIYNVTVHVSDGTLATTQDIVVTVTAVNDNNPVVTSSGGLSVAENATIVTTVTATDADLPAQSLIYSIASGADLALFSVNSSTGELTFVTAPDFEAPADSSADNVYNLTVQTSDGVTTTTQDLVITITAVNENSPVITSSGNLSIAENTVAVTAVTATDIDLPAEALTYSIAGGADSVLFNINSSTSELTFIAAPDFESPTDSGADNVYNVVIQASDGILATTQDAVVTVAAVNDNNPVVTSGGNLSVAENTLAVTVVTATDADLPTQSLTYSIAGGVDSTLFSINSLTGELTFVKAPDFESPADSGADNVYNLTIQVSDGVTAAMQDVVVTVTAVNENSPAITSNSSLSITENATAAMTVTGTDADLPTQSLTYSIAGGVDLALFNINSSTGELTFIAAPDFETPKDAGADNIYNVTVQASDGEAVTTQDVIVTVKIAD